MNNLAVVEKGSLATYHSGLIEEQQAAVRIAEEIIKVANERNLPAPKECLNTVAKAGARLKALNAGFFPTEGLRTEVIPQKPPKKRKNDYGWLYRRQRRTLAIIDALPDQVKEAITDAKSLGIFEKIAISQPGGDPVIVGHAGSWKFLIASWVNLMDGQGIGFRFKL